MLTLPAPPVADARDFNVDSPQGDRNDPYYWLRDDTREDPEMLEYLRAENAYTQTTLEPVSELRETLFQEILSRIAKDDSSVPYALRGYLYYRRFEREQEYPVYARRSSSQDSPEEILLDGNKLGEGEAYFAIGGRRVSPDNHRLAYAEDRVGRRQYEIRVKNLETGELFADRIPNTTGRMVWAADSETFFYIEKDPTTLLGIRVKRHQIGTSPSEDPIVYEENDHSFYISLGKTGDGRFLTISLQSTVSSELRTLPAEQPTGTFKVFAPRERDHEYSADHIGNRWIVRSNWQALNFRILAVDDNEVGNKQHWSELIPHSASVFLEGMHIFSDHLVISERSDALQRLRIRAWKDGHESFVQSDEPAYSARLDVNRERESHMLRYSYTSLTTPASIYEVDMDTGVRSLLKQEQVLGGFDRMNYVTERISIPARDGAEIPVSLVYRKGFSRDGSAPLYQYAYGSYGSSSDPSFRSHIISLLDRGFVYAIAHVRGGQEKGRAWYEQGKLLHKKNTFTDFIDVTEQLVARGYTAADQVVAMGGSAGGLLTGAVVNMRPDLYRVVVSHVPFVDVVTTMLDETIPLTTNEFDEWGNPKHQPYYDYMLSYSPYDNVEAKNYPAMLVTSGLWDSQVQYFEPAKWVAKLRAKKTDTNPLLLHMNMDAGHGGASGRFRRHRDRALEYAFILQVLGVS